jgi:hypothetical protein
LILFLHDYSSTPLANLVGFGRHIDLGSLQMMIGKVAYLDILSGMLLLLNYAPEVGQLLCQLLLLSAMDRCSGAVGVMYGDLS